MLYIYFLYIMYICLYLQNLKNKAMTKKLETLKDTDIITITMRIPVGEVRAIDRKSKAEFLDRTKLIRKKMREYCND